MEDNYENWQRLALQIIIKVIEDYKSTSDTFLKESLLKWFDTGYGASICELAGMDPDYIKKEVYAIEKHIRYDNTGAKKVHPTTSEESKYTAKRYNIQEEFDKKGNKSCYGRRDKLLTAYRYYQQKGQSCDWIPPCTKIRAAEESQRT